jgi:hypothetical protein
MRIIFTIMAILPLLGCASLIPQINQTTEKSANVLIIGEPIPGGPRTDDYLMGRTDQLPCTNCPCNVTARKIYRSLNGHDRHYLVGWIPDGRAHVVVVSDDEVYDPIFFHSPLSLEDYSYWFRPLSISESDGWHLASFVSIDGGGL